MTKARSLSVAMTGPQLTVADVFPSSAKTLRSDGQVSLKEGAWISKIRIKEEIFSSDSLTMEILVYLKIKI